MIYSPPLERRGRLGIKPVWFEMKLKGDSLYESTDHARDGK